MIDINKFLQGYIGAALWSTTDSRDEEGDDTYTLEDEFDSVSDACKAAMLSDCEAFVKEQNTNLHWFKAKAGCDDWRLGFLFWLNREGHGSGFWDELPHRINCNVGDVLSAACKPWGSFPIYGDFEMGKVRSHHYG